MTHIPPFPSRPELMYDAERSARVCFRNRSCSFQARRTPPTACLSVCTVNRSVFYMSEGAVMSGRPWICHPRLSHRSEELPRWPAIRWLAKERRSSEEQTWWSVLRQSVSRAHEESETEVTRRWRDFTSTLFIRAPSQWQMYWNYHITIPLVFYISSVVLHILSANRAEACGAIHPQKKADLEGFKTCCYRVIIRCCRHRFLLLCAGWPPIDQIPVAVAGSCLRAWQWILSHVWL